MTPQQPYDINGKKDGEWIWFYPSGKPFIKESYHHGVWDRVAKEYYKNGNLKEISYHIEI